MATERLFGMGAQFEYLECQGCGSLQILEVPEDLAAYYPKHYYSFTQNGAADSGSPSWLRRTLRGRRAIHAMYGADLLGSLVSRLGPDYFTYPWRWFAETQVQPDSRILDVGCGQGKLLRALRENGFTKLFGVDPFIGKDVNERHLQITCGELADLRQEYDLIMMHHSLEHVLDVRAQLEAAADRCRPGGHVLVRIPIADGYGWRHYRNYWFALDAPRHLIIPTKAALCNMAEAAGLKTKSIRCDAEAVCFWGSEMYLRGMRQFAEDGSQTIATSNPFTKEEMKSFALRAETLNADDDGDIACFIFRKPL